MKSNWWRVLVLVVVVVGVVLLVSGPADAQCAMCRSALTSATNSRFMRNFNIGVLVLLAPPVAMFCSIFVVLRKYRNH
jgi:drug/metabolite transporter (DMT)-like permease